MIFNLSTCNLFYSNKSIHLKLPWGVNNCTRLLPQEFVSGFIFLVFFFFFSEVATSQITVSFSSDVLQGCSPVSAAFTNESTPVDGSTYLWDFGNGNVSTARNPQTSYLNPGLYTVKLTVTNGGVSETLIKEDYIVVHAKPQVQFVLTGDTIGCSPFPVSFSNLSTDPENSDLTYEWSFGDGAKSTEQNPTHNYSTQGNFDVTILATNTYGCNASFTQSQLVHVLKPVAIFGVGETFSCTGTLLTSFTNSSEGQTTLESLWDFGDGTTSNLSSPSHQYNTQGAYNVKLTVTDAYGCTNEVLRNNLIQVVKTVAKFDISADTICPRQNLVLSNNSEFAEAYLWRYGDQTTATAANVNKLFIDAGDYVIWLIARNGSCIDSISKKINVEYVKANFQLTDSFICELPKTIAYQDLSQNGVTWSWRFGNGSQSVSKNPSVTYGTGIPLSNYQATFSDTLVVTSKHGCTDRFIKQNSVLIQIPDVRMVSGNSSGLDVCIPTSILFTDQSSYITPYDFITSRQWTYKSTPAGSELTTQINVNETGNIPIELTITTSKGCVHKKTEYVSAGQTLSPNFTREGNYEACASDPVNFIITSPAPSLITNTNWDFGDGATDMMLFPPHTFIKTGPMDVTLTVYNYGCASEIIKPNIVKINGPIVSYSTVIDCELPNDRIFNATITDATNYTWSFGDGSPDISNQNDFTHTFPGKGEYAVILNATNGSTGCAFEFRRDLFVRNIKSDFQLTDGTPCLNNTLTIDGSGSNDAIDYFNQENYGKYLWYIEEENATFFTDDALVHKFSNKGVNHVSLVVQDINGCKDTLSKEITIYRPEPNFEANYKVGCMPVTFEFTDLTQSESPINSWLWNFGNGSTSTDQNPTYDYTSFGGFNISLEVTDEIGCTAKLTKSQLVKAIFPDASFEAHKTQFCVGDTAIFKVTSPSTIVEHLWQISDGRSSNLAEPDFKFNEPGQFAVSLYIKDSHGCETTNTVNNYLDVQKFPIADFEADVTNSNCYPLVVQFQDKSDNEFPGSWEWHFGENNNLSELKDPFFIYNRPGNHNVRLISRTTYGCSDTIVKQGFIHVGGPFATIGLQDTVCQQMDVFFSAENQQNVHDVRWDFGDGYSGFGDEAVHQYKAPGTIYPVLFIRSDANNTCNKAVIDTLSIFDLQAQFALKDNINKGCVPFGPELIDQSINATSWIWEFGDGMVLNEETPHHQYPTPGDYDLRLIALHSLGCRDTSGFKRITVFPLPTISINKDTIICKDGSAQLLATGGVAYSWIPPEALLSPNAAATTATPDETTIFQVFVTDENSCENTDETMVTVQQLPFVTLRDTILNIGEIVSLDITDAGIASYVWTPNDNISCSNCPNPVFQPLQTTTYQVAVTDTSACFTMLYPIKINIIEKYSVDVPNAFTPNGDGINDRIFVKGWGIKEIVSFKIYNRMGQEVYSSSNLNEGWDGTFKGKSQPIETYSYNLQVRTFDEKVRNKSGTLKLLK